MKIALARRLAILVLLSAGGCATFSPASRIETRLSDLGLSSRASECLADELADNLDRSDLNDVADFLDELNRSESTGGTVNALRSIDNPRAAATIAAAGIYCALGG